MRSDYSAELREKLGPTMVANWKLWPAAHIANFALVPNEHRILYINVVSVRDPLPRPTCWAALGRCVDVTVNLCL